MHAGSPAKEYFPLVQAEHQLLAVAAGADVVPAGQVPEQEAFVKPMGAFHTPPRIPQVPRGQSEQDEDPAVAYLPSAQTPEQPEFCIPGVAPQEPAGHKLQEEEPAAENVPAGHVPEQVEVVSPVVAPHVPPGQLVQVDALANAYLPRGQIVQPAALLVPDPVTDPAYPGAQIVQSETEILPVAEPVVEIPLGQDVHEEPVKEDEL
jgi:hypothetical protein